MKKLALFILGIILGALAMYFYFHSDQNSSDMAETTPPTGVITPSEITALTQAYNDRYDIITNTYFKGVTGGDNRSSWYSIEDLEAFLASAKKQAGELGYIMNGVRLYPGAHPTVDGVPGYTTFLLVPTGYEKTSEGNMIDSGLQKGGGKNDIGGANGMNQGENGIPPGINYPQ